MHLKTLYRKRQLKESLGQTDRQTHATHTYMSLEEWHTRNLVQKPLFSKITVHHDNGLLR